MSRHRAPEALTLRSSWCADLAAGHHLGTQGAPFLPHESSHAPPPVFLRLPRRALRYRRRSGPKVDHRAVPHPDRHHSRCARRPRRVRQGTDRIGQDARLRYRRRRPPQRPAVPTQAPARAGPHPDPRAGRPGGQRAAGTGHARATPGGLVLRGRRLRPQLKALSRGVDVAVACPGRLADLIERGSPSSTPWRSWSSTKPIAWPTWGSSPMFAGCST